MQAGIWPWQKWRISMERASGSSGASGRQTAPLSKTWQETAINIKN